MATLKEGRSIIKVRPKAESGEWGSPSEITVFVDTLAPLIVSPSGNASVGDASIMVAASEIKDDVSETNDVSKIDWIKFILNKDDVLYAEQTYSNINEINSPTISHVFTISVDGESNLDWEIIAQDVAGNQTSVSGTSIEASSIDLIMKIDSNIFIGHSKQVFMDINGISESSIIATSNISGSTKTITLGGK